MKTTIKFIALGFVFVSSFLITLSCNTNKIEKITQVAYFKDSTNIRVFIFTYKQDATENEIKANADNLAYSSNRITHAYYFAEGSNVPTDEITTAIDFEQVNTILYEDQKYDKWDYSFIRNFDDLSKAEFANCKNGDFANCK